MQTLGSTIKEIRENKKLSIQDISVKTNIIAEYIEAIENDNFSILPAEVYVKGFLRNISHVLEIDSNKIISLYQNRNTESNALESAKLLEEYTKPIENETEKATNLKSINKKTKKKSKSVEVSDVSNTKVELEYSKREQELLLSASSKPRNIKKQNQRKKIILLVSSIIVLISIVIFLPKVGIVSKNKNAFDDSEMGNDSYAKINIVDNYAKVGVKKGDTIYFKPNNIDVTLEFTKIDGNIEAVLNGFEIIFSKTAPFLADINKNGIDDFRLQLIDIVDNVAMIEIERIDEVNDNSVKSSDIFTRSSDTDNVQTTLDSNIQIINGDMYVLRNVEQSSIVVEATARRFVYVRYFVDNLKPITTNLSSGNSISITAEEVIMLTIGNASEIVLRINGKSVVFGNAGETVNKTIKWIKNLDNSTKFDLVVTDTK